MKAIYKNPKIRARIPLETTDFSLFSGCQHQYSAVFAFDNHNNIIILTRMIALARFSTPSFFRQKVVSVINSTSWFSLHQVN